MINLSKLQRSISCAARGLYRAWREEQNIRIHAICAILITLSALLLKIGNLAFSIIVLAIVGVIALELINTVIERLADALTPRVDPYLEVMKDLIAAAVFIAAVGAVVVGILIFVPPIIKLFSNLY